MKKSKFMKNFDNVLNNKDISIKEFADILFVPVSFLEEIAEGDILFDIIELSKSYKPIEECVEEIMEKYFTNNR